jgi:DNA-binding NtrC family response regulator
MHRTRSHLVAPACKASISHTSGRRSRILVVDDEAMVADTMAEILRRNGYATEAAYDGARALETILLSPPELVITDVVLPGISGVELAITIKRVLPECKILLCSGQASTPELMRSDQCAPYDFTLLSKPVPPSDLLALVKDRLGTGETALAAAAA